MPKTNHTGHQKPIPSRETVPLKTCEQKDGQKYRCKHTVILVHPQLVLNLAFAIGMGLNGTLVAEKKLKRTH